MSDKDSMNHSKDNTMKGATALLVLLTFINLFNYIDRYVLSAILEPIKDSLHIKNDGDVGRLATSFMLGYFLTSPIFGYLGDRISRKKLMAVGVIGWSLGTCLSGFAQVFSFMIFCRVLVGLGEASFGAIGPAVLSDAFSKRRRNTAMTLFYLAVPIGAALGFTIGGLVASSWGWRYAFYVTGLPGFILAALLFFVKEPKRGLTENEEEVTEKVKLKELTCLFTNKSYVLATLGYIFYTFSMGAYSFWGPTFLSRVHNLNVNQASLFFGPTLIITGLLGTLFGGWLANRWQRNAANGYAKLLSISMLFAVPFSFIAFLTTDLILSMVSVGISLFFLFQITGPINTVLMESVPSKMRASSMAICIFAIHAFGDLWSPELVGRTSDYFTNLRLGMIILPASFILAGLFWNWLSSYQKKNENPQLK